jgi:hypothetical protein
MSPPRKERAFPSRGDRHLGYSSRHTQESVPATTVILSRDDRL